MQDQIRRALDDLVSLSHTLSSSDQDRIFETINRFRSIVGKDDDSLLLYEKLLSRTTLGYSRDMPHKLKRRL
jgi:hypothetical protein